MKIKLAKTAGFCMGVRRAMEMTLRIAHQQSQSRIFTYGPLIHNPQVQQLLENKGIHVINQCEDLGEGTVVIRAHGISPAERRMLLARPIKVVDATCPRVGQVQSIIKRHAERGFHIVIVGHGDHPEVMGLKGFAEGGCTVISSVEEVDRVPPAEKLCVVAQTTQRRAEFGRIAEAIASRFPHSEIQVHDTICDSTKRRQEEIRRIAQAVDAVVVVGGKASGNTVRLVDVARSTGTPTYHIESEEELQPHMLEGCRSLAVTAGASTPNWVIRRVMERSHHLASQQRGKLYRGWVALWENMVKTNLFLALGAGSLSYATMLLQKIEPKLVYSLIASLYIFAMYSINHIAELAAARYNYPDRAELYEKNRKLFCTVSFLSSAAALGLGATLGILPFLFLLSITILGFIYNVPIVPAGFIHGISYTKLRDLPVSKTLLAALGWAGVTAGLPALETAWIFSPVSIAAFFYAAAMAFVRSGLFDLLDIQGDRIVGKETLPIMVGERWAKRVLYATGGAAAVVLFLLPAIGLLAGGLAILMAIPLGYAIGCIHLVDSRSFSRPLYYELTVDAAFFMAGFMAFSYQIIAYL
jgi:(E)-4-hydroxy-3-methyl-but-2-enyl pyrophosphate reductase